MRIILALLIGLTLGTAPALAADPAPAHDHAHDAAVEAHGAAAAKAEPTVFAGTFAQSVAAAIVFLLLVALLYKMAWGPILTGLQDRENKIKADLESAQKSAADAKKLLADYEAKLAAGREEAQKIVDKARADAEGVALRLQQESAAEIDQQKKRAAAEIKFAKEQALSEIYSEAAKLGTTIAGKLIKREINPGDQKQLVEEALAELAETKL